jgi:hypothetical protein
MDAAIYEGVMADNTEEVEAWLPDIASGDDLASFLPALELGGDQDEP